MGPHQRSRPCASNHYCVHGGPLIMKDLNRRIGRLEKVSGGDFDAKTRALAGRLGIPIDRVSAVAKGHEAQLAPHIGMKGYITWEAFCQLRELGLGNQHSPGIGHSKLLPIHETEYSY
jgi:hypothetical protein